MQIEKFPVDTSKPELKNFPEGGLLLKCSGDMLINTAESDYQKLNQFLASEKPLAIDLSGIDEMDSSGLQHFIAFKNHCHGASIPLVFINASSAVTEVLELFLLTEDFTSKAAA